MTDNLRDRIAAVLNRHYPITTHADESPDHLCRCGLPREHVADAVISELGLPPTWGVPSFDNGTVDE